MGRVHSGNRSINLLLYCILIKKRGSEEYEKRLMPIGTVVEEDGVKYVHLDFHVYLHLFVEVMESAGVREDLVGTLITNTKRDYTAKRSVSDTNGSRKLRI
jgi:hypothetical protein